MLGIIWHSRTGTAEALAAAAFEGAAGRARLIRAEDASPEALLACAGYLFICPENLGSMTGAMKEMFDRCYYPLLGKVEGCPYASIIAAGSDGHGALAQLDRIVTGWRLKRVAPPKIVVTNSQTAEAILAPKSVQPLDIHDANQLGCGLSEGIEAGIF